MLTKQDLELIREIVKEEIKTAIDDFAASLAPTFTEISNRLDKLEAGMGRLEEEVKDLGQQIDSIERKINALYTRGNRHASRIKRVEQELHLPAFV